MIQTDDPYLWGGPMNALGRMAGETPVHHATHLKDLIVRIIMEKEIALQRARVAEAQTRRLTEALTAIVRLGVVKGLPEDEARPRWKAAVQQAQRVLALRPEL